MPDTIAKPIIFLAFANNRADPAHFLDKLAEEERRLRETLGGAAELCDVVYDETATADEILALFQQHRDRIAIFHFAGHANSYQLLLETADGQPAAANAGGFAAFLGQQTGLELVFLNGCSTQGQVQELLAAKVPAVIATDQKIKDDVATDFAALFYGGLATGASIRSAFEQAKAGIRFKKGDKTRDLFEEDVAEATPASAIPWDLHARPDHDPSGWTLWEAAGNPLFGLPPLSEQPLPLSPFPGLAPYTAEQAELFFGRGAEIRRLFDWAVDDKTPPILLLHGQTGVGKSSLLDAGLRPRLTARQQVRYRRRDPVLGLTGTLLAALASPTEKGSDGDQPPDLAALWRATKSQSTQALTVILDQADEPLTRPAAGQADEYGALAAALVSLFADPTQPQAGKLILACRQEALAPIRQALADHGLGSLCIEQSLDRPDRAAIMEAVRGPAQNARLCAAYRVTIDKELPALVAEDLTTDDRSPIAPVLQVLLGEMWTQAGKDEPRLLGCSLYNAARQDGYGLRAFLANQITALQTTAPDAVNSGLIIDLLAEHATSLGAARARSLDALCATYPQHAEALPGLIQQCQDLYLLTELRPTPYGDLAGQDHVHRLAHDILALVVRQRYGESDLPGQRARRILENAVMGAGPAVAEAKKPTVLSEADLATVEAGEQGMRTRTEAEGRLVTTSRQARDRNRRNRKILFASGIAAIILIMIAAIVAGWQANVATRAQVTAEARRVEAVTAQAKEADARRLAETRQVEAQTAATAEAQARVQADLSAKAEVTAAADAKQKQAVAEREARRAKAGELAVHAQNAITNNNARPELADPSLPLLLAIRAAETTLITDTYVTVNAYRVLGNAIDASPPYETTLDGNFGKLNSATLSPKGNWAVLASSEGSAQLWDIQTHRMLHAFIGHTESIEYAAFSPDGRTVLTASLDRTARLWDVNTGQLMHRLSGHEGTVLYAAFNPTGEMIATTGSDKTIRLWDAKTGRQLSVLTGHTDTVYSVVFSNDGSQILSASTDRTARLWDVATGQEVRQVVGHSAGVVFAMFSPDGRQVLTTSWDATARLWDTSTARELLRLSGHKNTTTSAAFSPDGRQIVTASYDHTMRLWDSKTGQLMRELLGHSDWVNSVVYSPDGKFILSASSDGTARLWKADKIQAFRRFCGTKGLNSVVFSPDGKLVLTASLDSAAHLWDLTTGREITTLTGHTDYLTGATFSPDGTQIVTTSNDRAARLWDVTTGQELRQFGNHKGRINTANFSPDGTLLVTAGDLGDGRVWNVATGQILFRLEGHVFTFQSAVFSPDGQWLVTSGDDKTPRIWDAQTGREVTHLTGHTEEVNYATYSPDGLQIITTSRDKSIRFWDATTWQELRRISTPTYVPEFVSFSPDGIRFATINNDRTVLLWDTATAQPLRQFTDHVDQIRSVTFSPDGTMIASASYDDCAAIAWVDVKNLLAEARRLVQRDPPMLTPEERRQYGLD